MIPFDYERPADAAAAVALLEARPGAKLLAGGTNLVDLMKLGIERPATLVDISHLDLDRIEINEDGGLRIGAAARNSDLAAHADVRRRYTALSEAILHGASGQIRNLATTAGNLLQRTRCRYFQDATMPCNKRQPGSGCPAIDGDHGNLAILGGSDQCVATHPSDMAVALSALDASVELLGSNGGRTIPLSDLYLLPDSDPRLEYAIGNDEIITAVGVPALPPGARSTYRKVRERASYAFAICSVAAAVTVDDGVLTDVRIGLGAVAPKPWRAHRAEEALRGQTPTAERIAAAIDLELDQARPLRDNGYKVLLARRLVVATISDLVEEAS